MARTKSFCVLLQENACSEYIIEYNIATMNNRLRLLALFSAAAVFAALCLGQFAYAQAISGDIVGTVTDSSGAVVPGARLAAVNAATGVSNATTTNDHGDFHFVNLPIGKYNVIVTQSGFADTRVENVAALLNQTATLEITLALATTNETVVVNASAAAIDTSSAQLQTSYGTRELNDLPNTSRGSGVLNLSLLSAGVTLTGGIGVGSGGPSVSGQRPYNNNFTVEGVDNNNKNNPGPVMNVPADAVGSFSVLQNQFSPEFGHSNGGQFNEVIKSGTNAFHGELYEYFQNRHLIANNNGPGVPNPRYDNNRFGGQLGGPILRNKLFFFENLEYNPIGTVGSSGSVFSPTADGFTALNQLSGLSKTNLGVLEKFLQPGTADPANPQTITVAGATIPVGNLSVAYPSYTRAWSSVSAIDYNLSQNDNLRGRYLFSKSYSPDTSANLAAFYGSSGDHEHLVNIAEYHLFSPSTSNEARVGYSRLSFGDTAPPGVSFPGLDAFPSFNFGDLNGLQFGPNTNVPNYTIINTYSLIDNLSVRKGNHDLRFGVEGRKYISPQSFVQRRNGDYEYSTLDLFLHDLSPDQVGERSGGVPVYDGNQIAFYTYANDTWHVLQNLSVNIGLRYEYTTVPAGMRLQKLNEAASVPGLISFAEPQAPKKNFMPKVGFAWSPDKARTTSIRGGFGIGYDVLFDNIFVNSLPPQLNVTEDVDLNAQSPNFLANGGLPAGIGRLATFATPADARAATSQFIPVHLKDPYALNWNFGIQHAFGKDLLLEVRYVGVHALDENVQTRVNKMSLVTPSNFLPTYFNAPTQAQLDALPLTLADLQAGSNLVPAYAAAGFTGTLKEYVPTGSSIYHGLQTQLNKSMSHGLQFQAAWTWSRTIDNASTDFFSTYLTPRRPQDFGNLDAERSVSGYSRAHRVTMAVIYDTPWYKNSSNWALRNLVGNFSIAPIYTYESPEWADVQSAVDSNFNGDSAGDRAILNPAGVKGTGSDATPLMNTGGDVVAYLATDPTAQYIRARPGALATSSRNTLALDHINNFDASFAKNFSVTERFRIQFSAQIFNLWNHPQHVPGQLNDIAIAQATQGSVLNYLTPGQPNFNDTKATWGSEPRSIQLVLKFQF